MKLKSDFEDRLCLQGLFSASKYQPFKKMLSDKFSYRSVNELCRSIAHQLQVREKKYRKFKLIFKILCYYYLRSFYLVYSLRCSLIHSLVQCIVDKVDERKQDKHWQHFQKSAASQFRKKIHIIINQFSHQCLTSG